MESLLQYSSSAVVNDDKFVYKQPHPFYLLLLSLSVHLTSPQDCTALCASLIATQKQIKGFELG